MRPPEIEDGEGVIQMITTKENIVVYTIQLDAEEVASLAYESAVMNLFKREFEREGMEKEAKRMDRGGFSYRISQKNRYFVEYKVSIPTRRKFL